MNRNTLSKDSPNILVCPLNWGIGHATRCVPVIRELIRQNANVIIAADGRTYEFLKLEFPQLQFVRFPGYRFTYPDNGSMVFKMAIQAPAIMKGIFAEHKALRKIITDNKINGVISDNRFGLYTSLVPCVFITHQVKIKTPFLLSFMSPLIFRVNKSYISKYNECWIPDYPDDPNLSGNMSHIENLPDHYYFIGALSRFNTSVDDNSETMKETDKRYDFLVIISGPEPQRTLFENILLAELKKYSYSAIVVTGKPESKEPRRIVGNVIIYSHLETEDLRKAFHQCDMVISRSGYSTLMDLVVFGKKAIFIPTPGQTEQEYLANRCVENKWFYAMSQKHFSLKEAIEKSAGYQGFARTSEPGLLKNRISQWLNTLDVRK